MPQLQPHYTPAEYLALERESPGKGEYLDGEIFAMAGASREHNLVTVNIGASLWHRLRDQPCETYTQDMRVKIPQTGLYTYPDVAVICGKPEFEDESVDTLLNPTLLVEVLSPSTADYDRGAKFNHYRTLSNLQEYLLVAQDACHVVQYVRQRDGLWLLSETRDPEGTLYLPSLGCDLPMADIYARVHFDD